MSLQVYPMTKILGGPVNTNGSTPANVPEDEEATPVHPEHEHAEQQKIPQESDSELTAIRAHYLKKALVSLQFDKELSILTNPSLDPSISVLSYLGQPFRPPPKGDRSAGDLVFFRFIFRQFCLTFPFLASAPKDFFPNKLQPFVDSVIARNLTGLGGDADNDAEAQESTRKKTLRRIEKQLSLLMGSAIKLAEREEVVRLTQHDLDRLERLAKKNLSKASKLKEKFEINVVGIRTVTERRHLRSRVHEEFLVRTRRPNQPDVFVSRRAGDFKTLATELRKVHPEEEVRPPPQKDHSSTTTTTSTPVTPSPSGMGFPINRVMSAESTESLPMTPSTSNSLTPPTSAFMRVGLQREKNRLTLRAYLNSLLNSPVLASSPVLRSFLLDGPTQLTLDEIEDCRRREEADRIREEGRARFEQAIKDRVETLRQSMKHVKSDMLGKDGLTQIFATIRSTPNVRALPQDYRAAIEWGRISLASTLFQHLVASDSSSEMMATVKRLHGLMPYILLKGVLKISNPIAMVRGVLDLFLAQPFGGKSLLQRMFTTSLSEEVKALQEDISAVEEKVDDPVLCQKVRQFVLAPREFQAIYRADAAEGKVNLLTVILRTADAPHLSRAQMQRVARASRAHAAYLRHRMTQDSSDSDEGPEDEDAWLYEDLGVLLRMYTRLRDREQLIALIFEGTTAELFKDIITIFYSPLAQVYKAASIGESIGDLQNFVNDLIRTVDSLDESQQNDPGRTVQVFIDLVERHEQAFYTFVHKVHSKGEGLFDSLMRWIEMFLTLVRDGLGETFSLEFLLPHNSEQRAKIFEEVDRVARYHYKLKVAHEEKVKRRFGKGGMDSVSAAEDEAAQALVDGIMNEMSFGDLLHSDAADIPSDTSSEETTSEEATDSDSDSEETVSDDEEVFTTPQETTSANPFFAPEDPRQDASMYIPNGRQTASASMSSRSMSLPPQPSPKNSQGTVAPQHQPPSRTSTLVARSQTHQVAGASGVKQTLNGSGKNLKIVTDTQSPEGAPKKKKGYLLLKEPELTAIPELLPLFIEMIDPWLRQPRSL